MPLADVTGFGISAGEDQAVVIHLSTDTDLIVTLRGEATAVELVSLVSEAAGVKFPVDVGNQIPYKVKGVEKSLTFEEAEDATGMKKRRGSGFALVTRKASIMKARERHGISS